MPIARAYTFSKMRGTDGSTVGLMTPSSGTICVASPPQNAIVAPTSTQSAWMSWAKTWASGRNRYTTSPSPNSAMSTAARRPAANPLFVSTTPFGRPVVPDV